MFQFSFNFCLFVSDLVLDFYSTRLCRIIKNLDFCTTRLLQSFLRLKYSLHVFCLFYFCFFGLLHQIHVSLNISFVKLLNIFLLIKTQCLSTLAIVCNHFWPGQFIVYYLLTKIIAFYPLSCERTNLCSISKFAPLYRILELNL